MTVPTFCWQPVRPRPWHIIRRRLLRFPRGVMHWSAISGAIADYEAMKSAALMATNLGHPIVIDPVGVSGSTYRRTKCIELIKSRGGLHPR